MRKKIVFLIIAAITVIILGGTNNDFLYGSEYTKTKTGYSFSIINQPSIKKPNPENNSIGIQLQPTCNVTVSDPDGGTIDVYFYENTTGSWVLQQTNSSVDVTTPTNVIWNNYTNASNPSTKYWWSARTTDGETWTNRTYYFTTKT